MNRSTIRAQTVKYLCISDLFIDGNRHSQQRELWRVQGEGSEIRNNGITVQNVSDSAVEHVTCARCRSGGLVTTRGVRRLTVRDLTAFDNEFDGLACYQTTDCLFTKLHLHDNPGAGISLDLAFNHNVISNAVLTANDLGIFMRASRDNRFHNISIQDSRHYGVFMAHAEKLTPRLATCSPDRVRGQFLHQPGCQRLRQRGFPGQQPHLHQQCHRRRPIHDNVQGDLSRPGPIW